VEAAWPYRQAWEERRPQWGSASGDSLDGLIENVRRVQAEDGNLIAARAGVGDDRETIDFIDGDASGGGRGAVHVAGSQRNLFDNGEIHAV